MAKQGVQFLGGADQNVAVVDVFGLSCRIANSQTNRPSHRSSNGREVLVLLHGQCFQRNDVDGL